MKTFFPCDLSEININFSGSLRKIRNRNKLPAVLNEGIETGYRRWDKDNFNPFFNHLIQRAFNLE